MGVNAQSEVGALVENLFRRESGKLTASLTRYFGSAHLAQKKAIDERESAGECKEEMEMYFVGRSHAEG